MTNRIAIIREQLSNLSDISGKTSKSEYWNFFCSLVILFFLLVLCIIAIRSFGGFDITVSDLIDIYPFIFALLIIPSTIRRLNDINKSRYLILLIMTTQLHNK